MNEQQTRDALMQRIAELEEQLKACKNRSEAAYIRDLEAADQARQETLEIIEKSPVVVFLWRNETNWPVEFVTGNVNRVFGYSGDDFLLGRVVYRRVVHPDDRERVAKEVETSSQDIDRTGFTHRPYRIVTKNGDIRWLKDSTYIRRDQHGAITHYQGIVEDVTERIAAEHALKESEEKFARIFNSSPDAIVLSRIDDGLIIDVNIGFTRLSGYERDEVIGQTTVGLSLWADPDDREYYVQMMAEKGRVKDHEFSFRIKSGAVRDGLLSGEIIPCGSENCLLGTIRDITDQKQAEIALRESEERFRQIAENINEVFWLFDWKQQRVLYASPAYESVWGRSREALYKNYDEWGKSIHPDDLQYAQETFNRIIEKGEGGIREYRIVRPGGDVRWISDTGYPIRDEAGNLVRITGIAEDITTRKQAEKELQDLYETMDLAQKMAGIGYWNYDLSTGKRMWSSKMYEIFGCDPELGPPTRDNLKRIFDSSSWDAYEEAFQGALEGTPYEIVAKIIFSDRSEHIVHTQGYPRTNENGKITGAFGTSQDITERMIAEQALRDSEEKYRRIFENSVVGFFQSSPQGRFITVNPAFAKMLLYESPEELISNISDIETQYYFDIEDRRQYQQTIKENGKIENFEVRVKRKDGTVIWVSNSTRAYFNEAGDVIRYEGIVMDITQKKNAEDEKENLQSQLLQAQKMEAIGTLAGGIAHDFNNLLMGIQGRTSLMINDVDLAHHHTEHLKGIEEYVKSATDLTRQLLGFARGGKYEVKPTDLNDLVKKSSEMFGRTKKEIKIYRKFQKGIWIAEVDRSQIEQILLNLYVNAWQAMPKGGELYLQTENTVLDENYSKPYAVKPGKYVKISITDAGVGMDRETRQKIFDPFFTTKGVGRGTGLGLASVYGIVKNHGGLINVYSEIGQGSTFNIYLPATDQSLVKDSERIEKVLKGTETILLVDDEKMIVDVGQAMLEKLGYQVMVANGGQQAIALLSKKENAVDLVILDLIMPEMDGGKTFDRIRELRPGIPVILSSGYAINGQASEIINRGCNGFIQKPFNLSQLSQKIRQVLSE